MNELFSLAALASQVLSFPRFSKYRSVPQVLGDPRENRFKIVQWAKGFFAQPAKTGTVTWEQLVAMFFSLNEL